MAKGKKGGGKKVAVEDVNGDDLSLADQSMADQSMANSELMQDSIDGSLGTITTAATGLSADTLATHPGGLGDDGDDVSVLKMDGVEEGEEEDFSDMEEDEIDANGEEKKEDEDGNDMAEEPVKKKGIFARLPKFPSAVGRLGKPRIGGMRRFSATGLRRWSVKDQQESNIEPYQPALKFRARMDKRYDKFKRRKEEINELIENAEHNKIELDFKYQK